MKKKFEVDRVLYELTIDSSGCVEFHPFRKPVRSKYDLYPDEDLHQDFAVGSNAFKVFQKVSDIVIDYAYSKKPPRIYFTAATERKAKIFEWLVKRMEIRMSQYYYMMEYPKGTFNFYKRAN